MSEQQTKEQRTYRKAAQQERVDRAINALRAKQHDLHIMRAYGADTAQVRLRELAVFGALEHLWGAQIGLELLKPVEPYHAT